MTKQSRFGFQVERAWPLAAGLFLVVTSSLMPPILAAENTPETMFTEALVLEHTLREAGVVPSLNDIRDVISMYEDIVRLFPQSAFDDHSLWQGIGLAIEAYDRYHQQQDLETGKRLLGSLTVNHPTSLFAGRVPGRLRRLETLAETAWLTDITRERLSEVVRVTVTIDREVKFHSEYLANPSRLFFDLSGTQALPHLRSTTLEFMDDHVVREVRLGYHPNQVTRVVLDVENTDSCHAFTLYEPFRLVVDCLPGLFLAEPPSGGGLRGSVLPVLPRRLGKQARPVTSQVEREETVNVSRLDPLLTPTMPPSKNSNGVYSVARQLGLGISRIVIDPGHGGHDPGARGRGLNEADLVLDLALRLEERLVSTQPGLEVMMTRRGDDYLSLEARTALANSQDADLFISIHANASKESAVRGVETYFLDLAVGPDSEALAARENIGGLATMNHLDALLQTIAANSNLDESRDLAYIIQRSMLRKLRSIEPEVPDLGVKQAPFLVLVGAQMPSVLSEVSFITNEDDATLLATDTYRDLIVEGLLEGILQYQRSLGNEPVVAVANARVF